LQRQKEAHELRLAELKSEQDRQIETLRADISHLQDRGKHSNEREYAALTAIWENYSDLHTLTNTCVIAYIRYPDLQGMDVIGSSNSSIRPISPPENALQSEAPRTRITVFRASSTLVRLPKHEALTSISGLCPTSKMS